MKIVQHAVGVYEIKDFLTEQEIHMLLSSVDEVGFISSHPGVKSQKISGQSLSLLPSIINRVISCFDNAKSTTPITNIIRYADGESMKLHVDGAYKNAQDQIIFGCVIYLSNDFIGGEVNYPDLNMSIKPTKGSMIIHNSTIFHEVLPVISGNRYSITTFIFGDHNTKFII